MAQANSQSDTTIDHGKIRRWAEKRGGVPSTVKGTGKKKAAGILRLDFEPKDADLTEIPWDEFFDKFDKESLAFLYQEKTAKGQVSRFHKFVEREAASMPRGKAKSGGAKSAAVTKTAKAASTSKSATARNSAAASKAATPKTSPTAAKTSVAAVKKPSGTSKTSPATQAAQKKRTTSKKS